LYRQQLIELCQNKLLENQVNKEKELEKVSNTTNIKKEKGCNNWQVTWRFRLKKKFHKKK